MDGWDLRTLNMLIFFALSILLYRALHLTQLAYNINQSYMCVLEKEMKMYSLRQVLVAGVP